MIQGDGDRSDSALVRNAPALLGLGMVQALAFEMSRELQFQRAEALAQAKASGQPVKIALATKGISYGTITVQPDAKIDYSRLEGVDFDLVIKPFGRKGTIARLRRFVEDAARLHFGVNRTSSPSATRTSPTCPTSAPGPTGMIPTTTVASASSRKVS